MSADDHSLTEVIVIIMIIKVLLITCNRRVKIYRKIHAIKTVGF